MEWTANLLELPLLSGILFILVGMVIYIFPPKNVNFLYGYRTPRSMKSKEHWVFAQRYAAIKIMQCSIFLMGSSFLGLVLKIDNQTEIMVGIVLTLAAIFLILYTTEKALKSNFPNT